MSYYVPPTGVFQNLSDAARDGKFIIGWGCQASDPNFSEPQGVNALEGDSSGDGIVLMDVDDTTSQNHHAFFCFIRKQDSAEQILAAYPNSMDANSMESSLGVIFAINGIAHFPYDKIKMKNRDINTLITR